MRRAGLLGVLSALVAGSCASHPDSYPAPPQYGTPHLPDPPLLTLGFPNSHARILEDVYEDPASKGGLWTSQHPAFSFTLKHTENLDLYMRYSVHNTTFADTGPVTLTFHVNGEVIGRTRIEVPSEREYSQPVPWSLLQARNPVIVQVDIDPVWTSPSDGAKLGILLWTIGFEERTQ
jgi:hypothetical protein